MPSINKNKYILAGVIVIISLLLFGYFIILPRTKNIKEQDVEIILSGMDRIRITAEFIYLTGGLYNGENYQQVDCNYPNMQDICHEIKNVAGRKPTIYASSDAYCGYIKLSSVDYICIDSQGPLGSFNRESIYPGDKGHCDGQSFFCPGQEQITVKDEPPSLAALERMEKAKAKERLDEIKEYYRENEQHKAIISAMGAMEDALAAKNLAPQSSQIWFSLGNMYLEVREAAPEPFRHFDDWALLSYKRALELDPDNQTYLQRIEELNK